jgi:hypothetical protein
MQDSLAAGHIRVRSKQSHDSFISMRETLMNRLNSRFPRNLFGSLTTALAIAISLALVTPAQAQLPLVQISTDTFTNPESEHRTEVEPDTFAFGSTIVSTFQVARVFGGGGADVGFATSTNGGTTWTHGLLPGLTLHYKGGRFAAASDPSVVYDRKHGQWLILTLPIDSNGSPDVAVSRSTDGIHWGNPIIVDNSGVDDKSWITCDRHPRSPFYGNCYAEWDQGFSTGLVEMSTSTDGGLTWGPAMTTADQAAALGGQPLVQPNGTVVVPIDGFGGMIAFNSTDGGTSWSSTVLIANQQFRGEDGGLRSPGLPSAAIDGAGKIYVVWPDCRFRSGCSTDDIVLSTSTNGTTWTAPSRIPIDPLTSTVDHFLPGLGVDRSTSGKAAHLALTYYYYPVASCGNSCQLEVGFTISLDGGKTWTAGKHLAGPMDLSWLAPSQNGQMVGDYFAVDYANGKPFGVFAVAHAPSGGLLHEAMYTTKTALSASADEPVFSSKGEKPLPNVKGNYVWKYYDDEGRNPIPPSKQIPPPNQK